ncbi:MAG: electron transport complex subunit RsxC, partial [Spirochaetales bacterium]|nr:electron transport complex subunit RsxC [Spirochaetales bacterium]
PRGIHPPGGKGLTESKEIRTAALPPIAVIPLSQHIGAPAECLVQPGDTVQEEDMIGKAAGFVSANIHSSVPGTVKEIREIFLPNGMKSQAVAIELSGEFSRLGKESQKDDWKTMDNDAIRRRISDNGIVGMGGATFPTHVKMSLPEGKVCEYFIINAVECEPFLTSDHKLMLTQADEILEGIEIVRKLLNPEKVIIGIEANKMDAARLLEEHIAQKGYKVEVAPLKVKYPQGAEKSLIKAITGREVPSGKLPLEVGVINANVGTCFAIYEAVVYDKPLVERLVTVSGSAVKNPGVFKVRVGTPIRELIEECGGFSEEPAKIISGGPMMGFTFFDLDTPVTKGTSGIIALTGKDVKKSQITPCLSCGKCVAACPMGLNPTKLYKYLDFEMVDDAAGERLMDCVECGSCAYVCPAHLPLVQMFRVGKGEIRKNAKK